MGWGQIGNRTNNGVLSLDAHYRMLTEPSGNGGDGGATYGLFNRNMVISGRANLDPLTPAYQEAPGAINLGELSAYPETFGELIDQAEASAIVVAPTGNDLAAKTTYWTASATGNYILYSHPHLARTIRAYSFITYADYTPATWSLLGSNNGTDWTTLHSGTAPEWGAGKNQVDEDIDSGNIAPYLYHKLVVGLVETVTGESVGTGDDATVLFNLEHTPSNEPTIYVDAVEQVLDTDYTRSGGAITFTPAPATDAVITADYEWTRTAVRIYALQLWTDGITTQLGARVFADATDPLVIAFGNGETVEEVSLTSPLSLTIDPVENLAHIPPTGASVYSLLAYADYNPKTTETVLGAEPLNVDDFISLGHIRSQLASCGWSITTGGAFQASYPWTNMFDGNWSSYAKPSSSSYPYTGYVYIMAPEGIKFVLFGLKAKFLMTKAGHSLDFYYTQDRGSNWTTLKSYVYPTYTQSTETEILAVPLLIDGIQIRLRGVSNSTPQLHEAEIYSADIPGIGTAGRKFGNGIVQIYDSTEEAWVQKNRVYLGTLNMGKGLDGNWAVNGFVPFNMPPQNIVPFPKKTFPARW